MKNVKNSPSKVFTSPRRKLYLAVAAQLMLSAGAHAAPTGGKVVGGDGVIDQNGLNTTITQNTHRLSLDWNSFDIQANERVEFVQPSASSVALNRILSNDATEIFGQLDANGHVILMNPNGIIFGKDATVNVGGLIASGLAIDPDDFMNGDFAFGALEGTDGSVINHGLINAATGGNVALIGKRVENTGLISAKLGTVILAAGKQAVLTFDDTGMLGVRVSEEVLQNDLGVDAAVSNSGDIHAEGGKILLTGSVSQDIFTNAVNAGDLNAKASVVMHDDGSFTLGGGADVVNTGTLNVASESSDAGDVVMLGENITHSGNILADSHGTGNAGHVEVHALDTTLLAESGTISATAAHAGEGGDVKVLGERVGVFDQVKIDASGIDGGGDINIGGGFQGKNNQLRNATRTVVTRETDINANAIEQGDGGDVVVWADQTTAFTGEINVRGGELSGNGGFVEVSGKQNLKFDGHVDRTAVVGENGTLLLDPENITIQGFTSTANGDNPEVDDNRILFDDRMDEDLTIGENAITGALLNGDVILQASGNIQLVGPRIEAGTILVNNAFVENTNAFILEAGGIINVGDSSSIQMGGGDVIFSAGVSDCGTADCLPAELQTVWIGSGVNQAAVINTTGQVTIRAAQDIWLDGSITGSSISLESLGGVTVGSPQPGGSETITFTSTDPSGEGINISAGLLEGVSVGDVLLSSGESYTLPALAQMPTINSAARLDYGASGYIVNLVTNGADLAISSLEGIVSRGGLNAIDVGGIDGPGDISLSSETGDIELGSRARINVASNATDVGTSNVLFRAAGVLNIPEISSASDSVAINIDATAGSINVNSTIATYGGGFGAEADSFIFADGVQINTENVSGLEGDVSLASDLDIALPSISSSGALRVTSTQGDIVSDSNLVVNGVTTFTAETDIGLRRTSTFSPNDNVFMSAGRDLYLGASSPGSENELIIAEDNDLSFVLDGGRRVDSYVAISMGRGDFIASGGSRAWDGLNSQQGAVSVSQIKSAGGNVLLRASHGMYLLSAPARGDESVVNGSLGLYSGRVVITPEDAESFKGGITALAYSGAENTIEDVTLADGSNIKLSQLQPTNDPGPGEVNIDLSSPVRWTTLGGDITIESSLVNAKGNITFDPSGVDGHGSVTISGDTVEVPIIAYGNRLLENANQDSVITISASDELIFFRDFDYNNAGNLSLNLSATDIVLGVVAGDPDDPGDPNILIGGRVFNSVEGGGGNLSINAIATGSISQKYDVFTGGGNYTASANAFVFSEGVQINTEHVSGLAGDLSLASTLDIALPSIASAGVFNVTSTEGDIVSNSELVVNGITTFTAERDINLTDGSTFAPNDNVFMSAGRDLLFRATNPLGFGLVLAIPEGNNLSFVLDAGRLIHGGQFLMGTGDFIASAGSRPVEESFFLESIDNPLEVQGYTGGVIRLSQIRFAGGSGVLRASEQVRLGLANAPLTDASIENGSLALYSGRSIRAPTHVEKFSDGITMLAHSGAENTVSEVVLADGSTIALSELVLTTSVLPEEVRLRGAGQGGSHWSTLGSDIRIESGFIGGWQHVTLDPSGIDGHGNISISGDTIEVPIIEYRNRLLVNVDPNSTITINASDELIFLRDFDYGNSGILSLNLSAADIVFGVAAGDVHDPEYPGLLPGGQVFNSVEGSGDNLSINAIATGSIFQKYDIFTGGGNYSASANAFVFSEGVQINTDYANATDNALTGAGNVSITSGSNLSLPNLITQADCIDLSACGTLSVSSGGVDQSIDASFVAVEGILNVAGRAQFDIGQAGALALGKYVDNNLVNFGERVDVTSSGSVDIDAASGFELGPWLVAGDASIAVVNANANLFSNSALQIQGIANFGAGAPFGGDTTNSVISLLNTESSFGELSIVGGQADIRYSGDLVLGNIQLSGGEEIIPLASTFVVDGSVTQVGDISGTILTLSPLAYNDSAPLIFDVTGDLTLDDATNQISSLEIVSAQNATITNSVPLALGNVTANNLTYTGSVDQNNDAVVTIADQLVVNIGDGGYAKFDNYLNSFASISVNPGLKAGLAEPGDAVPPTDSVSSFSADFSGEVVVGDVIMPGGAFSVQSDLALPGVIRQADNAWFIAGGTTFQSEDIYLGGSDGLSPIVVTGGLGPNHLNANFRGDLLLSGVVESTSSTPVSISINGGATDNALTIAGTSEWIGLFNAAGRAYLGEGTDVIDIETDVPFVFDLVGGDNTVNLLAPDLSVTLTGGTGTDTLNAFSSAQTWAVDQTGSGVLQSDTTPESTVVFTDFESLVGGEASDTFVLSAYDPESAISINAGEGAGYDVVDYSQVVGDLDITVGNNAAIGGVNGAEKVIGNYVEYLSIIRPSSTDTSTVDWQIEGVFSENSLSIDGGSPIAFENFSQITGGAGVNTFTISGDFIVNGAGGIIGGEGENNFVLAATGISVDSLQGAGTSSSLEGFGAINNWTIRNYGSGSLLSGDGLVEFSDIENVIGGTEQDIFNIATADIGGMAISGSSSGLFENNILVNQTGTAMDWRMTSIYDGTLGSDLSQLSYGNINVLQGGDPAVAQDVLYGLDENAGWSFTETYGGQLSVAGALLRLHDFGEIRAGGGIDTVNVIAGVVSGVSSFESTFYAGAGNDVIDINNALGGYIYGGEGNDTFQVNTVTFRRSMHPLDGGEGNDTLVGLQTRGVTWRIREDGDIGYDNAATVTGFENIRGAVEFGDTFMFSGSGDAPIAIDAGDGTEAIDTVDYSAVAGALNIVFGSDQSFSGVSGAERIIGNNFIDAEGGEAAALSLVSTETSRWQIAGIEAQSTVTYEGGQTLRFERFNRLGGGMGDDAFFVTEPSDFTGVISGGAGVDTLQHDYAENHWSVTGLGEGYIDALGGPLDGRQLRSFFEGMEVLEGNEFRDSFAIATADIDGMVFNGGTGLNSLAWVNESDVVFQLETLSSGTVNAGLATAAFNDISSIAGSGLGVSQVNGLNVEADWRFSPLGGQEYSAVGSEDVLTLSQITHVQGGDAADHFYINAGDATINIVGGDGIDSLSAHVNDETVNNQWQLNEIAPSELNGAVLFTGVENLVGNGGDDTVTFAAGSTIGDINTAGGADSFVLNANIVTGLLNGGLGEDTLDYNGLSSIKDILGQEHGAAAGIAEQANIELTLGQTGGTTLVGVAGMNAVWTINDGGEVVVTVDGEIVGGATRNVTALEGIAGAENTFIYAADEALGISVKGGADGNDSLRLDTEINARWEITGLNSGTMTGEGDALIATFSEIADLIGSTASETFTINEGGSIASVEGRAGVDTLVIADHTMINNWQLGMSNSVELVTSFNGIDTIVGNELDDTFSVTGASDVLNIEGGAGVNQLDLSGLGRAVEVNLQTGTAAGINVEQIESYIADSAQGNVFTGIDAAADWAIQADDAGRVAYEDGTVTYQFSGFTSVTGGTADDQFELVAGPLAGTTDGGAGNNRLSAANIANTWALGEASSTLNERTFRNFQSVTGGNMSDDFVMLVAVPQVQIVDGGLGVNSLTGFDQDSAWAIGADNSGTVTGLTSFANIHSFYGGEAEDVMNVAENTTFVSIGSGAGNDTINIGSGVAGESILTEAGSDLIVMEGQVTLGDIDMGSDGVGDTSVDILDLENLDVGDDTAELTDAQLIASLGFTLTGHEQLIRPEIGIIFAGDGYNIWHITGENQGYFVRTDVDGNVEQVAFDSKHTLRGGSGQDVFVFANDEAAITALIDGGVGDNTVALTWGEGGEATAQNLINDWLISGENEGSFSNDANLAGNLFSGIASIIGGANDDHFIFSDGAMLAGGINGGAGQDSVDLQAVSTDMYLRLDDLARAPVDAQALAINNVNRLVANADQQTVILGASDQAYSWVINGVRSGEVTTTLVDANNQLLAFENITAVTGGDHDDVFQVLTNDNALRLDGGNAETFNSIDYSQVNANVRVALASLNGFGLVRGNSGGIDSINSAELVANDSANTWTIGGVGDGINDGVLDSAGNVIRFEDFDRLTGGSDVDTFNQVDGVIIGELRGGAGNDVLNVAVDGMNRGTTFIGGLNNDTMNISGASADHDLIYTAAVDGGQFEYRLGDVRYAISYEGTEFVNEASLATGIEVAGTPGLDNIAVGNNYFTINNSPAVSHVNKNDVIVRGGLSDFVEIAGNIDIAGTFGVVNATVVTNNPADTSIVAQKLLLEGTRDTGAFNARIRTSVEDLELVNVTGDVFLQEQNGLNLSGVSTSGELDVVLLNGNLTNNGIVSISNDLRVRASDGNITLTGANQLQGALTLAGNNVEVHSDSTINFVSLDADSLNLVSQAGIGAAGAVTVVGDTQLSAVGNITMLNPLNDFNRLGITQAHDVSIADQNGIVLTGITTSGRFDLLASGIVIDGDVASGSSTSLVSETSIEQNGSIKSGANVDASALNGDVIVADGAATDGSNVSIRATGNLQLQDVNGESIHIAGGELVVNGGNLVASNGDISVESGSFSMNVGTVISAGDGSIRIAATDKVATSDEVTGNSVSISGNDVTIDGNVSADRGSVDVNATTTVNVNRDIVASDEVKVSAAEGSVNQAGNINADTGSVSVSAGSQGSVVMGADSVTASKGGDVAVSAGQDVVLGSVQSPGNVTIRSDKGGIVDGNEDGNNITAGSLVTTSDRGLGDADALETNTRTVDSRTNTGNINIDNTGSLKVDNVHTGGGSVGINNSSGDITLGPGSISAKDEQGRSSVTIDVDRGSVKTDGPQGSPTISGDTVTIKAPSGSVGEGGLNIDAAQVYISARNRAGALIVKPGTDLVEYFSGSFKFEDQLLAVEPLEDVNPAVFTNIQGYFYNDISLRMPADQRYDEEEE